MRRIYHPPYFQVWSRGDDSGVLLGLIKASIPCERNYYESVILWDNPNVWLSYYERLHFGVYWRFYNHEMWRVLVPDPLVTMEKLKKMKEFR